ncbi:MAG: hypothetical protein CMB52_05405 [Euryarchaeota archaeon]|nr:hypothetical protein [Euryarchaeota archaeon]MBJ84933.1 hypothetical protein [Euryarchaeota archaeon]
MFSTFTKLTSHKGVIRHLFSKFSREIFLTFGTFYFKLRAIFASGFKMLREIFEPCLAHRAPQKPHRVSLAAPEGAIFRLFGAPL